MLTATCRPRFLTPALLVLSFLAALLMGVLPSQAPSPAQAQGSIEQLRGVWVDSDNPGYRNHPQVDELVANVARANANTIFVQMRRHGNAYYNASIEPRTADGRYAPPESFDPLAYLIEKAHSQGIKVHAWLVISVACRRSDPLWGHPQHVCTDHGPEAEGTDRWTTATYDGAQVGDLDFGHPEAVHHMERVVTHLLANYPTLDGIHYDFVRYSWGDYGYNQVSLDRFRMAYGLPADYWPAPEDGAWSQWRRDQMTNLVRRLYLRIKAARPQVEVSAATITWGGVGSYTPDDWPNSAAYKTVYQDWKSWLQEGILDFAVPMHYFDEGRERDRGWYDSWLAWDRANSGRRAIVAGTGAWLNSDAQGIAQIERALAPDEQGRRLAGVALYSYDQPLAGTSFERRREFMDQLRQTVFAQPARPPAWPWVYSPTNGHIQGIATIDGQFIPDARVTLFRDGVWAGDLQAQADGWYGAVELAPGRYTVVVQQGDRSATYETEIRAGLVTSI
jgi:uncharacterized lipoprotein YddW (UPF0748 family)